MANLRPEQGHAIPDLAPLPRREHPWGSSSGRPIPGDRSPGGGLLWPPTVLALLLAVPADPGRTAPAPAPSPRPNQPETIHHQGLAPPPCPLIVPRSTPSLQPLRIQPAQVPLKNALGCLSPADALYGPDGCPRQVCGSVRGDRVPVPWKERAPAQGP